MGWELGEGLGHVQRLLRVARGLAARGHRTVFALCNVVESWSLLQRDSFAVLQAPLWSYRPLRHGPNFLASSFADVLAVRGWDAAATLHPLVEAWQQLIEHVKPRLIVTDCAPTLCLAAYLSVPVVQVGNWFSMPPVHAPTFPLLVPGQPPAMPQEELLKVVQEVQRRRMRPIPKALTSVLAAGDRFPTFFPELDGYQTERSEQVWDPLEPLAPVAGTTPEPRFFAYLTAENPSIEPILTQMALTGVRGTVYVRSAPADLKDRLRLQGLTVFDEPANLEQMLAESAVIVHHGGSSANSAFAAGRPQILLPQHLEQITTAQLLARLGVAVFLLGNAAPEAASRALRQVLTERRFADNAALWARRVHDRPRRPTLPAIIERCEQRVRESA